MNKRVKKQRRNANYIALALQQLLTKRMRDTFSKLATQASDKDLSWDDATRSLLVMTETERKMVHDRIRYKFGETIAQSRASYQNDNPNYQKNQAIKRRVLMRFFKQKQKYMEERMFRLWKSQTKFTATDGFECMVKGSTDELEKTKLKNQALRQRLLQAKKRLQMQIESKDRF